MIILGFLLVGVTVAAAVMTPLLAIYFLFAKMNHPLDEPRRDTYVPVPIQHPEFHRQLRGIDRG